MEKHLFSSLHLYIAMGIIRLAVVIVIGWKIVAVSA
jgi:hypothetical protein